MNERRNFLKSASLLAAGTALPATAAAASNNPKWDEEVDVLIIGSGFAGLSAAYNLKKQGIKDVLVLDKMQVIGGNSAINGGWLAIPQCPPQVERGIEDSPELLVQNQLEEGEGMADEANLRMIANHSLDVWDLCQEVGVEFRQGFLAHVGGHNARRALRTKHGVGGDITTKLYEHAKAKGARFRLQAFVEDFTREGERITGVVVREGYRWPDAETGTLKRIKARHGVICASGGYAQNKPLRQAFQPALDPTLDCTNARGATGEVMLTAMSHGALPVHLSEIQTGHWGSPDEGGFGWSVALLSIYWKEGIAVGVHDGKRFMNERAGRKYCSERILKHRNADNSPRYPVVFGAYTKNKDDERVTRSIRDGIAWVFDSTEALAANFGIPEAQLQATIDQHNAAIEQGVDELFGKPMDMDRKLEAPFLASRIWPKVHYCMGGLKTDPHGRAIDSKTMTPIAGLYAIGEVAGGNHGASRLSSCSCLEGLAMGIVVAKTIHTDGSEA